MQKQVFQTNSSTRWKSFIWFVRILVVFLIVIVASVGISLLHKRNYDLKVLTYNAKKLPDLNEDRSKAYVSKSEQIAFAKHLDRYRKRHKRISKNKLHVIHTPEAAKFLPVRAGFYVNWDTNSSISLHKNINQLNMVLPEWIFQKDSKGNLDVRINNETLDFIQNHKVAVVPMLSNFFNKRWNGDSTYIMLKNPQTRKVLISRIKNLLDKNDFQGINIDLESLPKGAHPYLLQFSKELSTTLHAQGYITTIDINPTDEGVTYKDIAQYYDFIFLMAYNEHSPDDPPGSISSLNFVEKSIDAAMREVASEKVILCVASYGFDWQKGEPGARITYQGLISLAKEHNEPVYFNFGQSDLTLYYSDDNGAQHEAHCNDAAGTFNIIRTAQDYNAAGVALWFLGSEDERIWNFYSQNLDENYLKYNPFNYKKSEHINSILAVNYEGKGEILEMLNEPDHGHTKFEFNDADQLITNEKYLSLPSSYFIKRYGAKYPKKIALTFDDGPNPDYTPKILDILKEKKCPATFFVIGANIQNNIPLLRREYKEGHEIGNHTYTHPDLDLTSDNRERIELRSTRLLIESILGHSTLLFRAPSLNDAEPTNLTQIRGLSTAHDEGFISVTSFIDTNDWEEDVSEDSIMARAIRRIHDGNIILMHDAGGIRSETVAALPHLIDYYRKHGYEFVTVSALMGKTRDQVMPEVKSQFKFADKLDMIFFTLTFIWEHFLDGFFIVAIILIVSRLLLIGLLAIIQRQKEKKKKFKFKDFSPKVSIIVPAFNEEVNATRTVNYLLKSNYSDFEVIFVDDGSKDDTYKIVKTAFENNPKVRVLTKTNGGKAAALNFGIEHASGEVLVCIDADTILPADAIGKMIPFFEDPQVGSVAGNVRVGNTVNMLTNWQSIEYTTSQNFDRRAYDTVNAILVVPGAIGAFRKTAMEKIEGFTTDTLAEDCDLTLRMLRAGYKIRSCNEALALTEAPETLNMFMKQRSRWTFGMMQSFWKHRDLLFSFRKANIGLMALPNLLIFNFLIPILSPLVDILFIAGLFTHDAEQYIFFYLLYYLIDCMISALAYHYDHQKFTIKKALYLFVQRFVYRQLLFIVLFKAYKKAIKGELVSWGVLKRTGNVSE
ncbi:glycosyl transferase family 2 [Paludibacter propionicigenes WB4]|uniref:Glycosyl transferase family 2 n=1 Tax=Paludibacter propionicigenes (strain DSM 17365 / JCM 13257 / WB4) TaxID=694427 RepID=E4T8K9_PALPW|nr:glycosyltransferase [Paludibacter propionicigenes]ADQ81053.1 glycosyl transferase family 2 [Paludibacter propionicigenes WB4]